MNYIKHLAGFFDKISKDDRLNPTHVSLYVSLFQFWNASRFHNPISISRNEAMRVSKICSKATYHKCIRELNDFGYLSYHPSYNPFKGSLVYLFDFQSGVNKTKNQTKTETSHELALNKQQTSTEQALASSINNTNIINSINNTNKSEVKKTITNKKLSLKTEIEDGKSEKKSDNSVLSKPEKPSCEKKAEGLPEVQSNASGKKEKFGEKKKVSFSRGEGRKDEAENNTTIAGFQRPLLLEVQTYFQQNNWPAIEADKYFNHYQSNGWLVAGKTPMVDWQASAKKWILNENKFNLSRTDPERSRRVVEARSLSVVEGKNYNEPL